MTRSPRRNGRGDAPALTPSRAAQARARSWPAASRGTARGPAQSSSCCFDAGGAGQFVGCRRSCRHRGPAGPGRGRAARQSPHRVFPLTRAASRVRGASVSARGGLWALRISLRIGFCSARPLIPVFGRGWWGAWIRPLPPHVHSSLEQEGSDPGPPRSGGGGSADGRNGGAGTEEQRDRTDRKDTGAAASAAKAAGKKRRSSGDGRAGGGGAGWRLAGVKWRRCAWECGVRW
jgi:hypothetical protein